MARTLGVRRPSRGGRGALRCRLAFKLLPLLASGAILLRSLDCLWLGTVWRSLRPSQSQAQSRHALQAVGEQQQSALAPKPKPTSASRKTPRAAVPGTAMLVRPEFMIDASRLSSEDAVRSHTGNAGESPEVKVVAGGETGLYATIATYKVHLPAQQVFEYFTDPDENFRIFEKHTAAVNYRNLIEEDKDAGLRTFEVSKSGKWRILGIPFSFESTVYATEDWKALEISYRLKKPGAMKHMAGFWRCVPLSKEESLVVFYHEAEPSVPLPSIFRSLTSRFLTSMASSMLEDVRERSQQW
mmetsp:Transcript_657/g.1342  ORF Transcript_657/g.1342 Transcript_657/m.1342 type:complete len:299 (-) Transcript_657:96-992(-)